MSLGDIFLIIGILAGLIILFQPRLIKWDKWRATITPLASIIGSGFLVSGPILAHISGHFAFVAMAALCLIGYLYGSIIRHNIIYVEPIIAAKKHNLVLSLERLGEFALILAYFISIAFYLNLFAAFMLRSGNIIDVFWINIVASLVVIFLGALGAVRGLRALEWLEEYFVGFKLAVIFAMILAMFLLLFLDFSQGEFFWPILSNESGIKEIQILLGLVILVQGFETSRYLGHAYDREMRVKTMRLAQWISTFIYVIFILLATRYFQNELPANGGETAIIEWLSPIGILLAPLLIIAAMASQFSAAIADMNGAAGLLKENMGKKFNIGWGYAISAIVALVLIWGANIYQIISFASKAFVLYYGLQSAQALLTIYLGFSKANIWRVIAYIFGVVLSILVIIFAIPTPV